MEILLNSCELIGYEEQVRTRTDSRSSGYGGGRLKLIATEEAGTGARRQHCQVPARAYEHVQPAGRQVRIGIPEAHRSPYNSSVGKQAWGTPKVTGHRPLGRNAV